MCLEKTVILSFWIRRVIKISFRIISDGLFIETSSDAGIKIEDKNLSLSIFGLKINVGNSLTTSTNGVDMKLADTSLLISVTGLQASSITYKPELQQ